MRALPFSGEVKDTAVPKLRRRSWERGQNIIHRGCWVVAGKTRDSTECSDGWGPAPLRKRANVYLPWTLRHRRMKAGATWRKFSLSNVYDLTSPFRTRSKFNSQRKLPPKSEYSTVPGTTLPTQRLKLASKPICLRPGEG